MDLSPVSLLQHVQQCATGGKVLLSSDISSAEQEEDGPSLVCSCGGSNMKIDEEK